MKRRASISLVKISRGISSPKYPSTRNWRTTLAFLPVNLKFLSNASCSYDCVLYQRVIAGAAQQSFREAARQSRPRHSRHRLRTPLPASQEDQHLHRAGGQRLGINEVDEGVSRVSRVCSVCLATCAAASSASSRFHAGARGQGQTRITASRRVSWRDPQASYPSAGARTSCPRAAALAR